MVQYLQRPAIGCVFAHVPYVLGDVLSELWIFDGEGLEVRRLTVGILRMHPLVEGHC